MSKISIHEVTKIFGEEIEEAQKLVDQGLSKKDILLKTGCTVGLRKISLEIPEGQFFVIMGLSGCGKSTLIRHINRLIEPTSGAIYIDNDNILTKSEDSLRELRRHKISMVFQHFGLLPHKTVLENIGYGLKTRGVDKSTIEQTSEKWLQAVGLEGLGSSLPSQLSGGMRQRVGLARAFATDPEILLMDEPFGALDPLIRRDMQDELIEIQKKLKKTVLFITHDLDEALRLGDQIAIFKDGEVVQVGSPEEIILHPKDEYVKTFTQDINRGKFISVRSIMQKHPKEPSHLTDDNTVDASTPIAELLPLVLQDASDHLLVSEDGNICGRIAKADIVDHLG